MKNKNGILILIVVGIAVMYYFVQKGKATNQMETPPEAPPAEDPKEPEVPISEDPKAGQNIGTSTVKEEAKYYFNHPFQNPMLNPLIMPGFILGQLKKKKKN